MAFAGMFIIVIVVAILLFLFICMMTSFIIAIIMKKSHKRNASKKKKILGNIFVIIGTVFAVPIIGVVAFFLFHVLNEEITKPNGEKEYVSANMVEHMKDLLTSEGEISITDLEYCLKKEPNLIYYHDVNRRGIIEYGLKKGDAEVVKLALSFGAVFDNPERYEHMAYTPGSMDSYLDGVIGRKITYDDVEIIKLMFQNNASTEIYTSGGTLYSNVLGKAMWSVLYNDETVTDIELEFIQVFHDNGLLTDEALILYEEKPGNVSFSSDYCFDVIKDDNYYALVDSNGN